MTAPTHDILWFEPDSENYDTLPVDYRNSLLESGSLIDNLSNKAGNLLQVSIIREGWSVPLAQENNYLNNGPEQEAYLREIKLTHHALPWIYARSIFPKPAYDLLDVQLSQLGTQPLGNILYQNENILRNRLEIAKITPDHTLYSQAGITHKTVVWGRRSSYEIDGHPLLLIEIFLPDFFQYTVSS